MSQINMDAILKKVNEYVKTPEFKKRAEQIIDSAVLGGTSPLGKKLTIGGAIEAADAFISVLREEIESAEATHLISGDIAEVLNNLAHDKPRKTGKNKYEISILFTEGLQRPSLNNGLFGVYSGDGIQNIAALLNNGYEARDYAYGVWEGHGDTRIRSKKKRAGAHFIDNAVRRYMSEYASKYGVVNIDVADIYR